SSEPAPLIGLLRDFRSLVAVLQPVAAAAKALYVCPNFEQAEIMARSDSADAFLRLQRDFEYAIERHATREQSRGVLSQLSRWINDDWIASCHNRVAAGKSNENELNKIVAEIDTLAVYQRFRARAKNLDPDTLAVFAVLRAYEGIWKNVPTDELERQ